MTHHGRPGGRLLELIIMFALIALSAATLCVGLAAVVLVNMWLLIWIDPIFIAAVNILVITYLARPIMRVAWRLAAAMWTPFMNYYGYEAHTFKPIKLKED